MTAANNASDPKRFIIGIAAVLLTLFGCDYLLDHLVLAKGNSVPDTVYWVTKEQTIKQGDYAHFEKYHPIIGDMPAKLTKQVVCASGHLLKTSDTGFYCDGVLLGGYVKETWDGKPLVPFVYNGVIPEGLAFMASKHARSFDSRYFGLVPTSTLTRVVGIF